MKSFLTKCLLAVIAGATAIMLLFYFADQGLLATAAKYVDDEPQLIKFMSDMGYPKAGDWCGEFAASIIKRAGGTPPRSAAVASNWRRYGTPDAVPHVGDVAVASRGVPTGELGSHVGFVIGVDLANDTFTLESGNASNIYTKRKISCFSFHTPPSSVVSALTGNSFPFGTATLSDLHLARANIEIGRPVLAISPAIPDDCREDDINTYETQNDDSLQRVQRAADSLDRKRICEVPLASSHAPRFCPDTRMTRATIHRAYRLCTATTTKGNRCLASRVSASACSI
jgi:uncharacterized protein (TIGR02594 family)